jgi:hypothetical protein
MAAAARLLGRINWPMLAVAGAAVALLWPLLTTGYTADDLAVSLSPGIRRYHGMSLLGLAWKSNKEWLQSGRFFPLSWLYVYTVFELFPSLVWYKVFVLTLIVANLLAFHGLVRRLSGSSGLAALSCLTVAALFQYRLGFDPILGFSGMMQALTLAIVGSLSLLCKRLESGRRRHLTGSLALYALAVLTYEMVYPFVLVHLLLARAYGRGWKEAARVAMPFVAVVTSCAAVSLAVRVFLHPVIDPAYQPNWDPAAYATMFTQQLVAALPLSYFGIDPHQIFKAPLKLAEGLPALAAVLLCALAALARWRGANASEAQPRCWALVAVGLSFWTLPALLVSLSQKYQQVVRFGTGYLTVYVEYFGVGLVLAWAAAQLLAVLPGGVPVRVLGAAVWAGALATLALVQFAANDWVVRYVEYEPYLRRNLEKGLAAGLIAEVPEGATLLFECPGDDWWRYVYNPYFVCRHGGKRLRVAWSEHGREDVTGSSLVYPSDPRPLPEAPVAFLVQDRMLERDRGYVFLSELDCPVRPGVLKPAAPAARNFRLFVRNERGEEPGALWVLGRYARTSSEPNRQTFQLAATDLVVLSQGNGWTLYSFDFGGRTIDPHSLGVVFLRGPLGTFWEGDFYDPEGPGDETHCCSRWCGPRGTIHVLNGTQQAKTVRLSTDFAYLERVTLTIQGDGWRETIRLPEQRHYARLLHVPPGSHSVVFEAEASKEHAPGDPRRLSFGVVHFAVEEAGGE